MRKWIYLALQIIAVVLTIKLVLWAYQNFRTGDQGQQQPEVLELDIICRTDADSGRCICRHRRTNDRIPLSYEECASRSRASRQ